MIWHKNQKALTPAEKQHMELVRSLGCCACEKYGVTFYWPVEIQHIIFGNRRMGNAFLLPLCEGHHRGTRWTLYQTLMIPDEARVSIASGSKAFARVYGTERELYQRVCDKLGLEAQWPETKILPRRLAGS